MASDYVEVKIHGLKELDAALKQFPEQLQKLALTQAVRAGADVVVRGAKARAPVAEKPHFFYPYVSRGKRALLTGFQGGRIKASARATAGEKGRVEIQPGLIRRSIRAWRVKSESATVMFRVGPRKKGKGYENDPWYWRFLEYGTKYAAARPFLRPAFDEGKFAVIMAMKMQLEASIDRIAKRLFKKAA